MRRFLVPIAKGIPLQPVDHPHKPRVLIWFWGTGGAGIRLADRVAIMLSADMPSEQVVVCGHADNELLGKARDRGNVVIAVSGAAGHRKVGALLRQALPRAVLFWRVLRHQRPDALIIPMNFAMAWPLALFAVLLRIPYAYMVHDAAPHPGDFAPRWQTVTQQRLVRHARCIIAPSAFTADQIRKRLSPAAPIHVVPLAALSAPRRTVARAEPVLPIRFLFLGRLIPYKGLDLLAQALKPLADNPNWRLTIAGTGPDADRVRAGFAGFSQVDLSELRALPEEAIERLISAHDVLICPYTEASQSGVIAEAGADAMPCLVTPVGALPEQVWGGRSGWIANGARPEDLRDAIEAILERPEEIVEKSKHAADFAAWRPSPGPLDAVLACLLGS